MTHRRDPASPKATDHEKGLRTWVVPALVAAITFLIFLPAIRNGFVSWDDEKNFINNPHYRGLGAENLKWMWTTFRLGHYIPLSWMTLGADYLAWGMNPAGYHLTNVALHAANAALLCVVTARLLCTTATRASHSAMIAAGIGALFFSLHPLRVESVAWVTERRDVLSLLFCLASLWAYLRAVSASALNVRLYLASLALFACALLSKGNSVTLVAVLFIINVYPLDRLSLRDVSSIRRVVTELAPFAMLAIAVSVLSMIALQDLAPLAFTDKIAVSAFGLGFYAWKTLLPLGLAPLYQMPLPLPTWSPLFIGGYVTTAALLCCAFLARRRYPGATAGLVAFIAITFPLLGIVQNGPQIAADRYTYHSATALAPLVAGAWLVASRRWLLPSRAVAALVLVALAFLTLVQIPVWRDSGALWRQVLRVDPSSSIANSAYASVLFAENRVDEAVRYSERAVQLAPGDPEANDAYGVALAHLGRYEEAISYYRRALQLKPHLDDAENNWGIAAVRMGDIEGAIEHYTRAITINPDNADAHVNLGNALVRLDRPADAVEHYRMALSIKPASADAELNWGVALARQNDLAGAAEHFRRALAIQPGHPEATQYLRQATSPR